MVNGQTPERACQSFDLRSQPWPWSLGEWNPLVNLKWLLVQQEVGQWLEYRVFSCDVIVTWREVQVILLVYRLNGDLVCYRMRMQNAVQTWQLMIWTCVQYRYLLHVICERKAHWMCSSWFPHKAHICLCIKMATIHGSVMSEMLLCRRIIFILLQLGSGPVTKHACMSLPKVCTSCCTSIHVLVSVLVFWRALHLCVSTNCNAWQGTYATVCVTRMKCQDLVLIHLSMI